MMVCCVFPIGNWISGEPDGRDLVGGLLHQDTADGAAGSDQAEDRPERAARHKIGNESPEIAEPCHGRKDGDHAEPSTSQSEPESG